MKFSRWFPGTPEWRLEYYSEPEPNSGCVLWFGARTKGGYGLATINGQNVLTHRLAYETHVGQIPAGKQLDHLCRVRCCINPAHLEPVTQAENVRRGRFQEVIREVRTNATHCRRGHAWTPDNSYLQEGGRGCRECRRIRKRLWRAAK